MKTVRKGCFETNSSSMHSLVYSESSKLEIKDSVKASTEKEFGWEYIEYNDPDTKISYWFMQYLYNLNLKYLNKKSDYYLERLDFKDFMEESSYSDDDYLEYLEWRKKACFYDFPYPLYFVDDLKKELSDKIKEVTDYFKDKGCSVTFGDYSIDIDKYNHYLIDIDGYIDHQSTPADDDSFKSFAELDVESLFDFVFNPDCKVITDNDNR